MRFGTLMGWLKRNGRRPEALSRAINNVGEDQILSNLKQRMTLHAKREGMTFDMINGES